MVHSEVEVEHTTTLLGSERRFPDNGIPMECREVGKNRGTINRVTPLQSHHRIYINQNLYT